MLLEVAKHLHSALGVEPHVLHKTDAVSVVQIVLAEAGASTERFLLGPALLNTWHRAFVLAGTRLQQGKGGDKDGEDRGVAWAESSLSSAWELLCKMSLVHDEQGTTFLLLCAFKAKFAHHTLSSSSVEKGLGNLADKQPLLAAAWLLANRCAKERWAALAPRTDSRFMVRIVTSSSAAVGCMPTVKSTCALVARHLMATANPCMMSPAPWPTI